MGAGSGNLGQVAVLLQPGLSVRRAFLREQHVHHLIGVVAVLDHELDQATGIRMYGRLAQLHRVHFTQSLEALNGHLATHFLGSDTVEHTLLLALVERVEDLLADIDPEDVLPPITAYYVMRIGRLPLVPYFPPGDMGLADAVGKMRFYSATYRLFKLDGLEPACEDYGQAVIYKGTLPQQPQEMVLDKHHVFERGRLVPVCGNTWRMLAETRFASAFDFFGDTDRHFGIFEGCGEGLPFSAEGEDRAEDCC